MDVYLVMRRFEYDVTWHVTAAFQSGSEARAYVDRQTDRTDAYRVDSVFVMIANVH